VQAVFQIKFAAPLDDMREKVAVERRILGQQLMQVEHGLGRDELVEPDLPWWDLAPFADAQGGVRVRAPLTDLLEDHLYQCR
jgi:hypothetical protein